MATKKITELTNLATPVGADVLPIVDDVAGTPTTKKVTATNLMTLAPVQSVAGQTEQLHSVTQTSVGWAQQLLRMWELLLYS